MITVRQIKEGDAPGVSLLSKQLGYTITEEETLHNIQVIHANRDHDAFVAVDGDKPVGWIHVFSAFQLESPPVTEVRGLVIDEAYRRKGIGKLLIEEAKKWCRSQGNTTLRLRCNVIRTEAHAFYLGIGFKEMKQQKMFQINV